jgi:hypothetical protein
MEYPEDNVVSVFDRVGARHLYAYSNENNEAQDLFIGASGNVNIQTDTFELGGDIVLNSNLVVNNTFYTGHFNVFRTFNDGHTISYGLQISDNEKLQIYKHDSRVNKSVVVNEFGIGTVTTNNTALSEQATGNLTSLYNKAKNVSRRKG